MGVAYVNVHVLRHLKEELSWAIDERFQLIINTMLFKGTMRCLRSRLSFFNARDFVGPQENHEFHC